MFQLLGNLSIPFYWRGIDVLSALEVRGIRAESGTVVRGWLEISELYDGSPVRIPVAVVNGAADGPVVWIQNGVHGDEYVGLGAIQRLLTDIDPRQVKGAIVFVPVLNVLAFRAGHRSAPQDGMDMNRVYPGKPLDQAMHLFAHSEIVVDTVFSEIKRLANAVLDLHDGGWMGVMAPYVQYFVSGGPVDAKSRELARVTGMDIVWESPASFIADKAPNSLKTATIPLGIPSLTLEAGGEGRLDPVAVERMYRAVRSALVAAGVLPGQELVRQGKPLLATVGHWIRPRRGGVFWPQVRPGSLVRQGELLAVVRDVFGEEVERLLAPVDGVVIGHRTFGVIATGQYAYNVTEVGGPIDS